MSAVSSARKHVRGGDLHACALPTASLLLDGELSMPAGTDASSGPGARHSASSPSSSRCVGAGGACDIGAVGEGGAAARTGCAGTGAPDTSLRSPRAPPPAAPARGIPPGAFALAGSSAFLGAVSSGLGRTGASAAACAARAGCRDAPSLAAEAPCDCSHRDKSLPELSIALPAAFCGLAGRVRPCRMPSTASSGASYSCPSNVCFSRSRRRICASTMQRRSRRRRPAGQLPRGLGPRQCDQQ